MNFSEWVQLRMEGEAARRLEPSPGMRVVDAPMSHSGFLSKGMPHGEYVSKHFNRYPFKSDENSTLKYLDKMKRAIRNEVQIGVEALAGYYGNDRIVKALDDFIEELAMNKIVV